MGTHVLHEHTFSCQLGKYPFTADCPFLQKYTETMLERTQMRALPIANRVAEHAPVATACCNACRMCVQTNLVALAFTGVAGLGTVLGRFLRRRGI